MVKRELAADPEIGGDSPRSKRHKDGEVESSAKEENKVVEKGASSEHEDEDGADAADALPAMSAEEVREEGLKVLQVLRDAVNKEGRQISYEFLRLPSKRHFPDYYQIIERPIALDDIKTQLENDFYSSLEALRGDLETCFKNGRRYNQRESVIWRDAKTLQKLAFKEIDKILRRGNDDQEGSDKEGGKKKEKGTNIHRLMKNRLQKLVEKEDDNGRRLSYDFMDLPSKKKWPIYYKLIKRPICTEDVFKRIKRKEYHTIQDFMDDVNLVFDNAISFNEEHSPIWEDASVLKAYFQQLMTSLPAKYNMNGIDAHSSDFPEIPHNKIKLKLPGHQAVTHSGGTDSTHHGEASTSATVRLRVPGLGGSGSGSASGPGGSATNNAKAATNATPSPPVKKGKSTSPAVPAASLPSSSSILRTTHASASPSTVAPAPAATSASTTALAIPAPKPVKALTPAHAKPTPLAQTPSQQHHPSSYTAFHQYTAPNHIPPQNFYAPPAAGGSSQTPARSSATPAPSVPQPVVMTGRTDAPSPVPPASAAGLYSVRLECCPSARNEPCRRLAILDARVGVRNFACRVPISEAKVVVRSIKFTTHDDDEGSEAEEAAKVVQTPVKKRGRGRPKKVVPIDQEVKPPEAKEERSSPVAASITNNIEKKDKREWRVAASSEVEVKLDGKEATSSSKESSTKPTVLVNGNTESSSPGSTKSEISENPDDEWTVEVTAGQHVLEIGRKGHSVPWRVYLTVS